MNPLNIISTDEISKDARCAHHDHHKYIGLRLILKVAKTVNASVPFHPHDREILPSGPDIENKKTHNIHMVQKDSDQEYESDSDDEYVTVQTKRLDTPSFANKQVKTPRENVKNQSTNSQKPKVNNKELGNESNERALGSRIESGTIGVGEGLGEGLGEDLGEGSGCCSKGKFVGKSDEGFLVGYSLQSKAFRVYNLVTKRVEENLHINFLENKPNVAGKGPNWLFDLDYLTDSMNYHPVSSENQANLHAGQQESNQHTGTKDKIDAGDSEKEDESPQDCFELPIWHSYSSTNPFVSKSDNKIGSPRDEEQV
ncbi:hypothetical protein Tco_0226459, partial [Tanacetum coccineum]